MLNVLMPRVLATDLLARGATFEDVADILGNSPGVVRKHYAKWSQARQNRIDNLMQDYHEAVGLGTNWAQNVPVLEIF